MPDYKLIGPGALSDKEMSFAKKLKEEQKKKKFKRRYKIAGPGALSDKEREQVGEN